MDYLSAPHQDLKNWIRMNINEVCSSYVQIGWYLNVINTGRMYQDDGYKGIGEYAAAEYGISPDRCSWLMKVAEKFCEKDTPVLLPEYKAFSISKLREMVYLDGEQLEEVKPETTVKEIRQMKPKPEKEVKVVQTSCRHEHAGCNRHCCIDCVDNEHCCADCEDHCNSYCGWVEDNGWVSKPESVSKASETVIESTNTVIKSDEIAIESTDTAKKESDAVKAECRDGCPPKVSSCRRQEWGTSEAEQEAGRKDCAKCWTDWKKQQKVLNAITEDLVGDTLSDGKETCDVANGEPEETTQEEPEENEITEAEYREATNTDFDRLVLAKDMLKQHGSRLKDAKEAYKDMPNHTVVAKYKLEVEAFTLLLESIMSEEDKPDLEQPELPAMKNNDQRKEFLDSYETWPIWIDNKETEERYYRYDLPDSYSIVVKVYFNTSYWEKKDTWGHKEIFLLKPEAHFKNGETNMTAVVEHLKDMQKKNKEVG